MSSLRRVVVYLALASMPALAADGFPVLESRCLGCHGAAKMSGLDLRTEQAALSGGGRGPAIVPGDASASLLYQAAARSGDLAMPPGDKALAADELAALKSWIDDGAPWPSADRAKAESDWWSFRKPERPQPPRVRHAARVRNPIDAFIFEKVEANHLEPAPAADRRTLIRRLFFDLHGLPPSPEQIEAFISDSAPDAYQRLVDRLLDSPRYGERWGRHWLDVARYADTAGFETDALLANAWRYRDYVIESFNRDKPYNRFIQEQIAADEIWPDNFDLDGSYGLPESKQESLHKLLGTGLYTLGAFPVEITFYGDYYRAEWAGEAVDLTASAFLGLTMECARCHDHKFDTITQKDYYAMAAMFAGSEEREIPIVSRMGIYEFTRHQTKWIIVEQIEDQIRRLDAEVRSRRTQAPKEPSDEQAEVDLDGYTPQERDRRETLLRQLAEAYLRAPKPVDTANVLVHTDRVSATYVLGRGDFKQKGERVEPNVPATLGSIELDEPDSEYFVPRRRKALAEWASSDDNPLTARVLVNRLWHWHFGRGIVDTPSDFGKQGSPPSHAELLDWLATEFVRQGWSIKQMQRLILTSDAYRRSSDATAAQQAGDPENIYLARMNRGRLEAEAIRDAVLAVSGSLNLQAGGPPVVPPLTPEEMQGMRSPQEWPVTSDARQHDRRSVYLFVKRSFRLPMFETFNAPDTILSCSRRDTSTVAPQALMLMNGRFMNRQADAFAARLRSETGDDPAAQISRAWRLALGRAPEPDEQQRAEQFLAGGELRDLCLLLLNMSEFVYVD